jgi:hypothetical protein
LELLQAGPVSYTINAEALIYMEGRSVPKPLLEQLRSSQGQRFDKEGWTVFLKQQGVPVMKRAEYLTRIITEGALIGSIVEQGLLQDTVIVSDGAGQFVVFTHGRCWVHAERNIYHLDPASSFWADLEFPMTRVPTLSDAFLSVWNFQKGVGIWQIRLSDAI